MSKELPELNHYDKLRIRGKLYRIEMRMNGKPILKRIYEVKKG